MSSKDLEVARQQLLKLRDEIVALEKIGEEAAEIVELDQARVGRLSRMDAMQAQAMSQASSRRRQHTKVMIEAALQRIDSGEYGLCRECEEPIDPRRLQFDPVAIFCIGCAEKEEQ
jgi:DnaK suppressor protein